jgi:SAM-dependent methyltransferase
MDHREAAAHWESNAAAWTELARAGYDVYRDQLNTPAFLASLPDVGGLRGIDIGCGEGTNTKLVAERGARIVGLDVSPTFVAAARAVAHPQVEYMVGSVHQIPFAAGSFDFATAFMSLMDTPDPLGSFEEIARVLKPGGFLQFSITHPCFGAPRRRLLRDEAGLAYAVEVGDYYRRVDGRTERWSFGSAPPEVRSRFAPFVCPMFHRTLSEWVMAILGAGFALEMMAEPTPSDETVALYPYIQDSQVVSYFLHVRCRKVNFA